VSKVRLLLKRKRRAGVNAGQYCTFCTALSSQQIDAAPSCQACYNFPAQRATLFSPTDITMSLLRRTLKYTTGNRLGQRLLQKQMRLCRWLMGIGAGAPVGTSGEVEIMQMLARSNRRDLVIVDAGANTGQFLNMSVDRLGDRLSEIHSFEPAAETFEALANNAPQRSGVVLNNLALGSAAGQTELFYDRERSGLASMTRRDLSCFGTAFDKSETIQVTTLDQYAAENAITQIDWLKIDVEGHELDVLRGAEDLLQAGAIDHVTFEFGGCHIDTRTFFRDFYQFFSAHGMRILRITPSGFLSPIKQYRESEENFDTSNFLAVSKDRSLAA